MRVLTRRAVLLGGTIAAAGTAALAVGETHRGRRWLHSVGLIEGPNLDAPEVSVGATSFTLASSHMARSVRWALAMPSGVPRALIVCLHGRGGSHRYAFDTIGVHRFVADGGHPWAVASVDGGASYWHQRADRTDAQAMVFEELLPTVRDRVGYVPLLMLGWSMGGYGALLAGTDHAEVRAVAATSPALWRAFSQAAPGSFDDADDFAKHDLFDRVPRLREMAVRIDCGDDDPFADVARALAERLPQAESAFGAGFHEDAYWRSRVPDQLQFFQRVLQRTT